MYIYVHVHMAILPFWAYCMCFVYSCFKHEFCGYTALLYCLVIISDGHGLHTEVVYSGEEINLQCEEHGIFMHFPESETEREIATTVKSLNISSDDCVLPGDAELVSAVYQIHVSEALPAVDLEIQHCVHLSNHDEALSMKFVHSNTKQGPPYHFTVIDGGQFEPLTRYGKIKLSSFSKIALVVFLKRLFTPPVIYATNLFRTLTSPGKYEVHVVVTKDLNDTITVGSLKYVYVW